MANFDLLPIFAQKYDVGRAALFLAGTGTYPNEVPAYWDGANELTLIHLGNTEGEIAPASNNEFSSLTLPENTGPAQIKTYLTGSNPSFTSNVFADPRILQLLSPMGTASGGNSRQVLVRTHTLWVVPEQLFITQAEGSADAPVSVTHTGGVWTKDGNPFTAEDERLFNMSTFFWKVYFEVLMIPYRHENGGKANMELTAHVMMDTEKPEGNQLWTIGADLATSGIDLGGESS